MNMDFLNILTIEEEDVKVKDENKNRVKQILERFQDVKNQERLLEIPFTTLSDYLWTLKIGEERHALK